MSINNSHYGNNGVLLYNGEVILIYYDKVELQVEPSMSVPMMKGKKSGRIYLTSHRMVFVNKSHNDTFQSFSMPFMCLKGLDIEQPVFGANFIKGEVKAEPQGHWEGVAKFKLWFNNGGAIEFGQCLMNAGRLASQARAQQSNNQFFEPQSQAQARGGNIYPAAPPAYNALNANQYNWVPQERFPDRPQGNNVYTYDAPPPYAGIYDPAAQQQHQSHKFDERTRVNNSNPNNNIQSGYMNPSDPSKVYVSAPPQPAEQSSSAQGMDAPPPSYFDNAAKKKTEWLDWFADQWLKMN